MLLSSPAGASALQRVHVLCGHCAVALTPMGRAIQVHHLQQHSPLDV